MVLQITAFANYIFQNLQDKICSVDIKVLRELKINYVLDKSVLYSQFRSRLPAIIPKNKQPLIGCGFVII